MKLKRILMLLMAIVVTFNTSLTTMAATWDNVDSWEELENAFMVDTDSEVIINLTGDIETLSYLQTSVGQKYIINGKEYTLTNVVLIGDGSVEINASLNGTEWTSAIAARENVEAVINGDINSKGYGVEVRENSSVIVNGNVTTSAIQPDEDGNLESGTMNDPDGYSDSGPAVLAWEEGTITINGDVTAGDSYGTYSYAGSGIEAHEYSNVTVNGNVTGGNQIANPDVKTEEGYEGQAGNGILMESTANVRVNGNVTGGTASGDGAYAGNGTRIDLMLERAEREKGSLYITGTVSGNQSSAENGKDGSGIFVWHAESMEAPETMKYSDFSDDYEAFNYLMGEASSNIRVLAISLMDPEEGIKWEEEHYWKILDNAYEEKIGESLWAIDSTEGSESINVIVETMNSVGMTEEEKNTFMESLFEIYNNAANELAAMIENIEVNYIIPEVTVSDLNVGEDSELVGYSPEAEESAETLKANIKYIESNNGNTGDSSDTESLNPETGDNFFVWTIMSICSMFGIVLSLRKKLVK